jgi:hypothetical protein
MKVSLINGLRWNMHGMESITIITGALNLRVGVMMQDKINSWGLMGQD